MLCTTKCILFSAVPAWHISTALTNLSCLRVRHSQQLSACCIRNAWKSFPAHALQSAAAVDLMLMIRCSKDEELLRHRTTRAGVVITTGYVHVLGDAASILTDPCLGLSTDFPWAFVFATFATLLTFCLEYFLQRYFRARLGLPQIAGASFSADTRKPLTPCLQYSARSPTALRQPPLAARACLLRVSSFCRTLHAGVAFHCPYYPLSFAV